MSILFAGLLFFFGAHLIPILPNKAGLLDQLGEKKYKGLIGIFSLIGIVMIVIGYRQTDTSLLWYPISYGRELALVLMPVSFILLASAHMKTNIKRYIKHPMLTGVLIWSLVHLLTNGEIRAAILFGAFAAYSVIDMIFTTKQGKPATTWPIKKDIIVVVAGLFAYGVVLHIHAWAGLPLL